MSGRPLAPALGAIAGALVFLAAIAGLVTVLATNASVDANNRGYAIATVVAGLLGGMAGCAAARRFGGAERTLLVAAGVAGPFALSLLFALTTAGDPDASSPLLRWSIPPAAGVAAAAGAAVVACARR